MLRTSSLLVVEMWVLLPFLLTALGYFTFTVLLLQIFLNSTRKQRNVGQGDGSASKSMSLHKPDNLCSVKCLQPKEKARCSYSYAHLQSWHSLCGEMGGRDRSQRTSQPRVLSSTNRRHPALGRRQIRTCSQFFLFCFSLFGLRGPHQLPNKYMEYYSYV